MKEPRTIARNDPFPEQSPGAVTRLECRTSADSTPTTVDVRSRGATGGEVTSGPPVTSGRRVADECRSVTVAFERGTLELTHLEGGTLHVVARVSNGDSRNHGNPGGSGDPTPRAESFAVVDYRAAGDMSVDVDTAAAGSGAAGATYDVDAGARVTVTCGRFRIELPLDGSGLDVSDCADGYPYLRSTSAPFRFRRSRIGTSFSIGTEDRIFGAGERMGFLDKRGGEYMNWNNDDPFIREVSDPLYQSIPFFTRWSAGRSTGYFLDYPGGSWFDFDSSRTDEIRLHHLECEMSLFVFPGPGLHDVVRQYTALTGRMPLPPKWALGFHQSRYSYMDADRVDEVTDEFRARDIPIDAVYFDIDYMDGYRVFTWDRDRFPDPEGLCARLREKGIRVVTIVDPGVKVDNDYAVYRDGVLRDAFAHLSSGEIYHGEVWPGVAAFPDFTTERGKEFWAEHHRELLGIGVAGIWNDMNEPADFTGDETQRTGFTPPLDLLLDRDGRPKGHAHYHNIYALEMARATHRAFAEFASDQRPFLLTRAGYAGIQRYAAVWNGDMDSSWHHLQQSIPMFLNMGLSGVSFVGSDVGGFQRNATPELYLRWMQYAVFTPYLRAHTACDTRDHEPWSFGAETERNVRNAIRLRYRLLPYLYSVFRECHESGTPVMRTLVSEWPDDERVSALWDQYLFGPFLMVAPVLYPDQRQRLVYLPAGTWYDYHTGERFEGPRDIVAEAPLDRIPVYVRAPAVIPLQEAVAHTGVEPDEIELAVYPEPGAASAGTSGHASIDLYEDDGVSAVVASATDTDTAAGAGADTGAGTGGDTGGDSHRMLRLSVTPENLNIEKVSGTYDAGARRLCVTVAGRVRARVSIDRLPHSIPLL